MPILKLVNINLSYSSEIIFLEISIDNTILFAKHISKLYSKISRSNGLLKELKQARSLGFLYRKIKVQILKNSFNR